MYKSFMVFIFLLSSLSLRASDFDAEEISFRDFETELQMLEAAKAAVEENAMKQVEAISEASSDNISDTVTTAQAAPEEILDEDNSKKEAPSATSASARSRRVRSR